MKVPDVLAHDLDIVFCGTAAGEASARRRAYYAGPGNAFWPTLYTVGLTPRQLFPHEYEQLLRWRMGLTDLAKEIAGNDNVLADSHIDHDHLRALLRVYRPRILAFTSKRAAHVFVGRRTDYGLLPEKEENTILFVLPSPSGVARRYWRLEYWQELARLRGQT